MPDSTADAPPDARPPGLLTRFIGIIFSPRQTFATVVRYPRWLGMLTLVTLIGAAAMGILFSTEAGQQAWLEETVRSTEAWGGQVDDRQYEGFRMMAGYMQYIAGFSILVISPLFTLIIAALVFGIFNAALGGDATFRQVMAVVTHSGAVGAVVQMFSAPLNYFRGAITSPTNLGSLLPILDENSFLGRMLGMIDLYFIWWIIVLAIGLSVLYRRRTGPIAVSFFMVYAVIALAVAGFKGMGGGG